MEGHRWGPVPRYSQWWSDGEGLEKRERDLLFLPCQIKESGMAPERGKVGVIHTGKYRE